MWLGKRAVCSLIKSQGGVVVPAAIVFHREPKQGTGVLIVGFNGSLVQCANFLWISTKHRHGRTALIEVFGSLFHRT